MNTELQCSKCGGTMMEGSILQILREYAHTAKPVTPMEIDAALRSRVVEMRRLGLLKKQ